MVGMLLKIGETGRAMFEDNNRFVLGDVASRGIHEHDQLAAA
jgi:hypothetical protein